MTELTDKIAKVIHDRATIHGVYIYVPDLIDGLVEILDEHEIETHGFTVGPRGTKSLYATRIDTDLFRRIAREGE